MCVKNECVNSQTVLPTAYVQVEFYDGLSVEELDPEDILDILYADYGIETDDITVGWEGDQKGQALRMVFTIPDEETAQSSIAALKDLQNKKEGVFEKAKDVIMVRWEPIISSGSKLSTTMLLFMLVAVLIF